MRDWFESLVPLHAFVVHKHSLARGLSGSLTASGQWGIHQRRSQDVSPPGRHQQPIGFAKPIYQPDEGFSQSRFDSAGSLQRSPIRASVANETQQSVPQELKSAVDVHFSKWRPRF